MSNGINLTPGRLFCLQQLARGDFTARKISAEAQRANGVEEAWAYSEWADKYMNWLRSAGLIEHTGERDILTKARIHRITEAGRKALEAAAE